MIGEGGEAVQLCLTEGERSEPSAVPTQHKGLEEVQPLPEFDLSEAVFMDGCVLQVRLAHLQLSIIGRFRRLSLYCF